MLLVHHADHLVTRNFECRTGGHCRSRRQAKTRRGRKRLFSDKISSCEKGDRGFFADCGNNRDSCAAFLEIKDSVCWISLCKKALLGSQLDDSSPQPGARQKSGRVKLRLCTRNHGSVLQPDAAISTSIERALLLRHRLTAPLESGYSGASVRGRRPRCARVEKVS